MLVVILFAGLVYALMWAIERRRAGGSVPGSAPRPAMPRRRAKPQPRQAAPDDDEDFLRWLDRKRRKDSPEQ